MDMIWKFPFEISDTVRIEMPKNAYILHIECQNNIPCMWAIVDPVADTEIRKFRIIGTGHPFTYNPEFLGFISTFQMGQFVWHVFKIRREE